jgi:RNA polymerase sigma-70 factor (ECF subfamily)
MHEVNRLTAYRIFMASEKFDYQYYAYLASRIRKGDSNAFAELYDATYERLYRYVYYFLKNPDFVPDALQEIYISVYKNIHSLKMDKLLIPWMKQIAYHVCCDFAKQIAGRHETATDLSDDTQASFSGTLEAPDCFQSVFDKDTALQLNTALSKLPVKIRQAFLLRYEQELKLEEIADFMDVSLSSVKRYINTAQKALQKSFTHLQTRL